MMIRDRQAGFTLMELMIAVVIVSILAAIAVPSYLEHMNKTRRTDGKAALLEASQKLERCYSMYNRFDHADCALAKADLPLDSPEGYYRITGNIEPGSYALTATPVSPGPQDGDVDCATLTINQLNQKGATAGAGGDASKCW